MSIIQQIVLRGDHACYHQRDGKFPYLDDAAAGGASGVLLWFYGQPFKEVAQDFIAYAKDRNLGVHLGIGIGAYDVCDGEDPLDPATMQKIQEHIAQTLDTYDLAGIEFQTGEYDRVEYKGETVDSKSHAEQLCETLNPYVDYALGLKPSLWVRSELNAEFCPEDQLADAARLLDPRCTVEWSRFTGPFEGPDCFSRGRRVLELAPNFSWFLKVIYRRDHYWKEIAELPEQARLWIEHWRGWVKMLEELGRTTLTICNVHDIYPAVSPSLPAAAVALAKEPDLQTEEVMARFFSAGD